MKNGYLKIGTFSPKIRVCDVEFNKQNIISAIKYADKINVEVLLFPELTLVGSTAGEMLYSYLLCEKALSALMEICQETKEFSILSFIGLPLICNGVVYNVIAVVNRGKVLCFIPKKEIMDSKFSTLKSTIYVNFFGDDVALCNKVIFVDKYNKLARISIEVGEDLFEPITPSIYHVLAGANVIVNCGAFAHTVESENRIISTVVAHSKRLNIAYALCTAGDGESTGDEVYSGNNLIVDNGEVLSRNKPFESGLNTALIDLEAIEINNKNRKEDINEYLFISYDANRNIEEGRIYEKYPFIPTDKNDKETLNYILDIQAEGLKKRVEHTYSKKLVLGLSGGLDSTLALLVAMRTINKLNRPLKDIIAVTMPCFGTTSRTLENSIKLAKICGVTLKKIDISKSVTRHLKDIGHSGSKYDAAFENAQARERTQVLMDLANMEGGLVIGTGDMSELALGWATYNGDHMSMYGVNAGVPKTLVKFLVKVYAENSKPKLKTVLLDIVGTPVSPELIPSHSQEITQKTEDLVGPYVLHDFFLYHLIRKGLSPKKVYFMAVNTFKGEFDSDTIKKWLETFIRRFFTQQFKRSCLPDGVKVFDFSLSPRGGFKMPSDASSNVWLDDVKSI